MECVMGNVSGIGDRTALQSLAENQAAEMAKALGLTEEVQVLAKEIAGLLSQQPSLRIATSGSVQPKGETGTAQGATGVPALDNPDDAVQREADLERLISFGNEVASGNHLIFIGASLQAVLMHGHTDSSKTYHTNLNRL